MPSNEYGGTPKVCRLCTTARGEPIDLLNPSGFCIVEPSGWIPQISQLKGGGVRIGSQSLNDDALVAGGYGPVMETFPLSVDAHYTAARVQELLNRLWEAEQFWLEGWQQNAVYLMVQLVEDSDLRYTRIKTGSFQIGNFAFGEREGLPNNTLVLEREPAWGPVVPGEMIGPFRNMAKNPSFERWGYYGIEDQIPSGWAEQIDANAPATHELRREETQIAGPEYALDMTFTGAGGAAPNEWYIWQWCRLLPDQDYTLKVWLNLTMGGGAGELFFIRIIERAGPTIHNETFAPSQNGWYYITFTTDREWVYHSLEIGFTAPATSAGSIAIIDRIFLTEGTWDANNWPGDFYMDSSIGWAIHEPEDYGYVSGFAYPVDKKCYVNIDGIPGDFDALARLALEFEAKELYDRNNLLVKLVAVKTAMFAEKGAPFERILYMNGEGRLASPTTLVGNSAIRFLLTDDQTTLFFSKQYSGDEITVLLNHTFKVFVRRSMVKDCQYWVTYWIGDPTKTIVLSRANLSATAAGQHDLQLITPKEVINWRSAATEKLPASIGFNIYCQNTEGTGSAESYLDLVYLIPVDNGGCWTETPIATGQALTLDSSSLSKPVQRAYGLVPFSLDSVRDVPSTIFTPQCCHEYAHKLYVFYLEGADTSWEYQFDGTYWTSSMTYAGTAVTSVEVFNSQLYLGTIDGDFYYYDAYTDTATFVVNVGAFQIEFLLYYGRYVYACWSTFASTPGAGGPTLNAGAESTLCMARYKHLLWVGCTNGVTHTWDGIAAGFVVGPVLPCTDDIVWMIEFQDKLFVACVDGDVYSWDGDTFTLSRTGVPANDDNAYQLEMFNEELYLLTGGTTQDVMCLFKTSDGLNWVEVWGAEAYRSYLDGFCMEVFAGRLACVGGKSGTSQWTVVWHAPLVATLDIPDHTGSAITLVPTERNRIHMLYETEQWQYSASYDVPAGSNALKLWFLPQWRALRSD